MSTLHRIANYAIIDGIERDIVTLMRTHYIPSTSDILSPAEVEKATSVLQRRNQDDIYDLEDHYDLLLGLDIGEKYDVLLRHKTKLPQNLSTYFSGYLPTFRKLVPIRHDTMHGRPITVDDQILITAVANEFRSKPELWKNLSHVLGLLKDDPNKLSALIGDFFDGEITTETLHNLPTAEYNDTGFVRRKPLETRLMKRIESRNPVITVTGEGGNGKSALVMQMAYNLVKKNDHGYDAIIWVSAKASRLTTHEIIRIDNAITDSLSLFGAVADDFEPGEQSPIDRVYKLLEDNTVLLIIDNLETVLDDKILEFAEDIPGDSKLVFTSRLPLGVGVSLSVEAFSKDEALTYFHALVDAYDTKALRGYSEGQILSFIEKLHFKPLLLKWFVIGVNSGLNPRAIINSAKLPFEYCMESVLDKLSENAKKVCAALSLLPDGQSPNVVQSVTGLPISEVEEAFLKLTQFSLIAPDKGSGHSNSYTLGLLVQNFLITNSNFGADFKAEVLEKYRVLVGKFQNERSSGSAANLFDINFFVVRSRDESIASQRLRNALKLANENRISEALAIVAEQKKVCPQYFEVYRASALIHVHFNNIIEAEQDYNLAIEADENQPQLHFWYAGFLVRKHDNYELAEKHYTKANELHGDNHYVLREWARNQLLLKKFSKAESLMMRAKAVLTRGRKNLIILNDLYTQKLCRNAEFLLDIGEPGKALIELKIVSEFLSHLKPSDVDRTLIRHCLKARPTIAKIKILLSETDDANKADEIYEWFEALACRYEDILNLIDNSDERPNHALEGGVHRGRLKLEGVTETYGFMRTDEGGEAFLHRSVCPDSWTKLLSGRSATFFVELDRNGRSRVTGLEL